MNGFFSTSAEGCHGAQAKQDDARSVQHEMADEEDSQVAPSNFSGNDSKVETEISSSLTLENNRNNRSDYLLPNSRSESMQSFGDQSVRSGAGWARLRTTIKVAGAVNQNVGRRRRKQSGLMRQDSFLKRFSTRHIGSTHIDVEDKILSNQNRIPKEDAEDHLRFVINPDENFMFAWLCIITLAVLYNLWTCIAREAFPGVQEGYDLIWFSTDALCDLIYLLDIGVQLRTGYLERGLIVFNSVKLAKHYIYSRSFVIDMLSLFPMDLIQIFIGIHPVVRFPRFLKAYRSYRFAYMVETRTVYPNMWRVANLSHVLFLGSHWFAAFYFMISKAGDFKGGWGYPKPVGEFASVNRIYLKSLYWSTLTLTTIGDLPPPESNWE